MVLCANLTWFLLPIAVIIRMSWDQPFTRFNANSDVIENEQ
jgi:hypothetical protein